MKTFGKDDANRFRQICLDRIEEIDPNRDSALALSGGDGLDHDPVCNA